MPKKYSDPLQRRYNVLCSDVKIYKIKPSGKEKIIKVKPKKKPFTLSGEISKCELKMKSLLDKFFPAQPCLDNYRPSWLVNPETGALLELDRYYADLKLAFEFQGNQHYKFMRQYHQDIEAFSRQVKRDEVKRQKCKEQGIFICYVHSNDLNVAGIERLLDGLERAKSKGKFWVGQKEILRISKSKKQKPRKPRNSKKYKKAKKLKVLGSRNLIKRNRKSGVIELLR